MLSCLSVLAEGTLVKGTIRSGKEVIKCHGAVAMRACGSLPKARSGPRDVLIVGAPNCGLRMLNVIATILSFLMKLCD